jgi:putative membrane protein
MSLLLRWLLSALALIAIAYYVPGISVTNLYAALVAALVLGLVNALIRPIILVLTLPFNVITLGLFTLVINALMFWFASTLVKGFGVAGFWPAFWGAMLMWLCNWLIASLLRSDRK